MIKHDHIIPPLTVFLTAPNSIDKVKIAENIMKNKYFYELFKCKKIFYVDSFHQPRTDFFYRYDKEKFVIFNNYIPPSYENFVDFSRIFLSTEKKYRNIMVIFFVSDLNWEKYENKILSLNFNLIFNPIFQINSFKGFFKVYFEQKKLKDNFKINVWNYSCGYWDEIGKTSNNFFDSSSPITKNIGFIFEKIFKYLDTQNYPQYYK
ncbi:hypothetical protein ['Cynodon dactylon' phytoplasma]|uniref:hypothetical protein n=1 Tax='Cynodon dactylon' phytoplasma TaxID=295320 RepID=UPI001265CD56|nr:hypothetical protein ['Cynodon dactylon' phytoplasma]KAB8121685.1 hypothetical protein F1741_02185 ['Cynodon dactylon' phytoplasma]